MTTLSTPTEEPAQATSSRVPASFRQAVLNQLTARQNQTDGLSLQALINAMQGVPRRSAQRWLALLVDAGWLGKSGRARATRYYLPHHLPQPLAQPLPHPLLQHLTQPGLYPLHAHNHATSSPLVMREPEASLAEIPLSTRARDTLTQVSRPLNQRQKVTYNAKLLEDYQPNVTAYLPADTCERLFAQGRVYADAKPAGTYARELANRLLIDLSWNSSRLEGNTYSLLETERLLAMDVAADNQSALDTQMILNHKVAIEFMLENAAQIGFNRYTVLNLHAMLSDNLLADPAACGGLRKKPVFIGQSSFTPADTPQQITEWFDLFLIKAGAIENPFEQALFTLVHLPYLQPFEDVNKRTARLAANIGLFAQNLCPLSFVDMPQIRYVQAMLGVYELGRIDLLRDLFVWAYLRSCARYNNYLRVISSPDPLRIKYRSLIQSAVAHIISASLNKTQAIAHIRGQAQARVEPADQARFVEVVETQLMSLHDGNMARYGIKPAQFAVWMKGWV